MDTPQVITIYQETENGLIFQTIEPNPLELERPLKRSLNLPRAFSPHSLMLGLTIPLILALFLVKPVDVSRAESNTPVLVTNQAQLSIEKVDTRALALKDYLASQNSPLKNYSGQIVKYADQNGIDWKLLPAISAVESRFGQIMPYGKNNQPTSFNAWGWGVYQGRSIYFKSWEDAISQVSSGIKDQFIAKGMATPEQMNLHYSSNPNWGMMVDYYINDIENYNKAFEAKNPIRQ